MIFEFDPRSDKLKSLGINNPTVLDKIIRWLDRKYPNWHLFDLRMFLSELDISEARMGMVPLRVMLDNLLTIDLLLRPIEYEEVNRGLKLQKLRSPTTDHISMRWFSQDNFKRQLYKVVEEAKKSVESEVERWSRTAEYNLENTMKILLRLMMELDKKLPYNWFGNYIKKIDGDLKKLRTGSIRIKRSICMSYREWGPKLASWAQNILKEILNKIKVEEIHKLVADRIIERLEKNPKFREMSKKMSRKEAYEFGYELGKTIGETIGKELVKEILTIISLLSIMIALGRNMAKIKC